MKTLIIPLCFFCLELMAQASQDAWINSQLENVKWQGTYKGVLADFHPVQLVLASDYQEVAGYLVHQGDQRKHKITGEWSKNNHFQLQERDEYDRLTGYLTGSITNDQVVMDWMSPDQSRLFSIKAFPENLIKIKNFKPVAEWIEITSTPRISLSVQKMDYGVVSGIANRGGEFSRFEGYCLDGTCSLWNTVIQTEDGVPIKVQMRQRDTKNYMASLNGKEYTASILSVTPLVLKQFDNSVGFLDFVYPQWNSKTYDAWLDQWVEKIWTEGVNYLTKLNQPENDGRLTHRSSGWIEVLDEQETYVTGLFTFIHPGTTRREPFVWLKKEDEIISQVEWLNTPEDLQKASSLAKKHSKTTDDPEYKQWLEKTGYTFTLPVTSGLVATTEFSMVYGDEMKLISPEESKPLIKRKYWKYFGW